MKISIFGVERVFSLSPSVIRKTVYSLLREKGILCDEVILHFVTKKKIAQLHGEFFDDPTPTDCISFPLDSPHTSHASGYTILGEVFVCPQVALEYAKKNDIDPAKELIRYVVHGILHLVGYEDNTTQKRKEMKQEEERILRSTL